MLEEVRGHQRIVASNAPILGAFFVANICVFNEELGRLAGIRQDKRAHTPQA